MRSGICAVDVATILLPNWLARAATRANRLALASPKRAGFLERMALGEIGEDSPARSGGTFTHVQFWSQTPI
jgi:hypothetical protein